MKKLIPLFLFLITGHVALAQAGNYPNGSTVANFVVTDTDGNTHNLHQYTAQGKYVMLDFFFDTCPPCQTTQPYYNQLHEVYGCNSADIIVLSINNGTDSDAEVIAFENTYGGPFVHAPAVSAQGGGGPVTSAFGVSAFPTYCLITPNNTMSNNDIWPISNMSTFVAAFPAGSNINPAPCALVGIQEAGWAGELQVYPVPSNGQVQLALPSGVKGSLVAEVYDALGRNVHGTRFSAASGLEVLQLEGLAEGQYLLTLRDEDGNTATRRIVIAR